MSMLSSELFATEPVLGMLKKKKEVIITNYFFQKYVSNSVTVL